MGSFSGSISRVALAIVATAVLTSNASALLNPPTPVQSAAPDIPGCDAAISPARAENGFLVRETTDSLQRKRWQPSGGDVPFTIRVPSGFDTDATVRVCVRWHVEDDNGQQQFYEASARIDSLSAKRDPTIVATVPPLPDAPPRWEWLASIFSSPNEKITLGSYTGLWLVPIADVRIMVIDKSGKIKADIFTAIGVTAGWWALLLAILSVITVFYLLCLLCLSRMPDLARVNPILRVITTAKGYASLSQFQIVLWTFVVGSSVIYVMALSGELIKITTGTLVLLGISGTAALSSQLKSKNEDAKDAANGAGGNAADAKTKAAKAKAAAAARAAAEKAETSPHVPSWCDLVIENGQIDVSRLQMLYFTVVMAAFVLMTVVSSYEIPEIPQSFLILMGISNGVYVAAKFTK